MKKICKKDILFFIIILGISIFICSGYLTGHYATDTYNIENRGYSEYSIINSLNDGRFFMFLIGQFANFIHIPIEAFVLVLTILAIIISCIIVIILKNMILAIKPVHNKWIEFIILFISYVTIFNFTYIENLYFVESTVMALSILFYLLSVKVLVSQNKNYIIKSLLLAILATFFYQGTICGYIVMATAFLLIKYGKDPKKFFKYLGIILLFCLVSFLLNLLQIKVAGKILNLEQIRVSSISEILKVITCIYKFFDIIVVKKILIDSFEIFPKYLFLIFVSISIIISLICSAKTNKIYSLLYILVTIFMTLLAIIAMCIISFSSYDCARIHLSIRIINWINFYDNILYNINI